MIDVISAGTMPAGTLEPDVSVSAVTIANDQIEVRLLALGAAIVGVDAPDSSGVSGPVHLGLRGLAEYADRARNPHLGAIIGRYANRISGASFDLDGTTHALSANNGPNTLHGGVDGWDRHVWDLRDAVSSPRGGTVVFTHESPAGDQGFPGRVDAGVEYELDDDTLRITCSAVTDAPTVVCMTNHGYWNLDGHPTVSGHNLALACDDVLPVDGAGIPTGALRAVDGTPFDMRTRTGLGPAIVGMTGGFDHCFAVRGASGTLRPAAVLDAPASGRWLGVSTDQRGLQLYTGNHLNAPFVTHGSVSLEAQAFPDSPNRPELGRVRLDPGETYRNVTEVRFGVGTPPALPNR